MLSFNAAEFWRDIDDLRLNTDLTFFFLHNTLTPCYSLRAEISESQTPAVKYE